jgi:hypothetical protein
LTSISGYPRDLPPGFFPALLSTSNHVSTSTFFYAQKKIEKSLFHCLTTYPGVHSLVKIFKLGAQKCRHAPNRAQRFRLPETGRTIQPAAFVRRKVCENQDGRGSVCWHVGWWL